MRHFIAESPFGALYHHQNKHRCCCCWSLKWYFLTKWDSVQCQVEVGIVSTIFLQMLVALHSKKTNFRRAELQLELDFGRNGSCDFFFPTNYTEFWTSNWEIYQCACLMFMESHTRKREKWNGHCQRVKYVLGNTVNQVTSEHDSSKQANLTLKRNVGSKRYLQNECWFKYLQKIFCASVSLSALKSPCLHILPNSRGRLGFLDQLGRYCYLNIKYKYWYWYQYKYRYWYQYKYRYWYPYKVASSLLLLKHRHRQNNTRYRFFD